MSLLRHASTLVRRVLATRLRCSTSVSVTQQTRKYGDEAPPGYDYTHLDGKDQVEVLDPDEPLTPEKRAALAAKYNLRPEDYIPLNDSDLTLGDYPKLPVESCLERDPYYDWDDPYHRRNYGEPIFHDQEGYTPMHGVDTRPLPYDRPQMWRLVLIWFSAFFICFLIGEKYYYFPARAPKQYPEHFPLDDVKQATGGFDYMENRWTMEAKVKERKEVTNYAFPGGWDPLAH